MKALASQLTSGFHGFTTGLKEYLVVLYKSQIKTAYMFIAVFFLVQF